MGDSGPVGRGDFMDRDDPFSLLVPGLLLSWGFMVWWGDLVWGRASSSHSTRYVGLGGGGVVRPLNNVFFGRFSGIRPERVVPKMAIFGPRAPPPTSPPFPPFPQALMGGGTTSPEDLRAFR